MDDMERKEIKERQELDVRSQILEHRVITMLDRKEMDFLDKLAKDALFSTGRKMSHSETLKWLVDFAIELGMTGEKIHSVGDFKVKLMDKIKDRLLREQYPNKEGSNNG